MTHNKVMHMQVATKSLELHTQFWDQDTFPYYVDSVVNCWYN